MLLSLIETTIPGRNRGSKEGPRAENKLRKPAKFKSWVGNREVKRGTEGKDDEILQPAQRGTFLT